LASQKVDFGGGQGCWVVKEGLMKKIIALVILAVVAAAFFGLTVPRHVLNTLGFAMADCTDGSGCWAVTESNWWSGSPVVAISRVDGTGGSFRAISIEAPHQRWRRFSRKMPLASRGVAGSQGRTPPSRNIPTTASLDIARSK
jgi:hypothetical protein